MEELKIVISETNRGKEQIIINKKYKYNYSYTKKNKSKVYRCTEYKTLNRSILAVRSAEETSEQGTR